MKRLINYRDTVRRKDSSPTFKNTEFELSDGKLRFAIWIEKIAIAKGQLVAIFEMAKT